MQSPPHYLGQLRLLYAFWSFGNSSCHFSCVRPVWSPFCESLEDTLLQLLLMFFIHLLHVSHEEVIELTLSFVLFNVLLVRMQVGVFQQDLVFIGETFTLNEGFSSLPQLMGIRLEKTIPLWMVIALHFLKCR